MIAPLDVKIVSRVTSLAGDAKLNWERTHVQPSQPIPCTFVKVSCTARGLAHRCTNGKPWAGAYATTTTNPVHIFSTIVLRVENGNVTSPFSLHVSRGETVRCSESPACCYSVCTISKSYHPPCRLHRQTQIRKGRQRDTPLQQYPSLTGEPGGMAWGERRP